MTGIDCGALTDRMPDLASGQAQWSEDERAHLAACASCGLEWRIVDAARRLGSPAAQRLAPVQLAETVIAGARAREKRARWIRAGWVSGLAAAAVLLLLLRPHLPPGRHTAAPPDTATVAVTTARGALPIAELDALDEEQLQAVLEHLEGPVGSLDGGPVPRMNELDDQQLESVLRSLEG
jgi:hypothetical protein